MNEVLNPVAQKERSVTARTQRRNWNAVLALIYGACSAATVDRCSHGYNDCTKLNERTLCNSFPQGDLLYRDLHVGIECRTVVTSYGEDAANLSCQVERPIG